MLLDIELGNLLHRFFFKLESYDYFLQICVCVCVHTRQCEKFVTKLYLKIFFFMF